MRAQRYLDSLLTGIERRDVTAYCLSSQTALQLQTCLTADAVDSVYSATITLAESLRGLNNSLYTWATIKFYYCAFFSTRSLINLKGSCVYYFGRSPYYVSALAGHRPIKAKGTTHKATLELFRQQYRDHVLLSQEIGGRNPLDWLMTQREDVNYRKTRFEEPLPSERFAKVDQIGTRRLLQEYLADERHLLTFDPDHAMMAFPLRLWWMAVGEAQSVEGCECFSSASASYLSTILRDRSGPLASLVGIIRQLQ